ncbi:hypothetical protein E2C01_065878 [Portunus trituberculatus]|uniref:Uncharacterized protein n=1 Tax=Portunus trituberculatus TaxID=210409 RepID=A0A5B7HNS1_PORTR|nr:hypothetical protein [Portunus trituberculatus]
MTFHIHQRKKTATSFLLKPKYPTPSPSPLSLIFLPSHTALRKGGQPIVKYHQGNCTRSSKVEVRLANV